MLRIKGLPMDFNLTIAGYIRQGHTVCPTCGGEDYAAEKALPQSKRTTDPLYGSQGKGCHCEKCGVSLALEPVTVEVL